MLIAVTGATGFLGRYIVNQLLRAGHSCRCWSRATSDRGGFDDAAGSVAAAPRGGRLQWLEGRLNEPTSTQALVVGADAVVHAALDRPGAGFRGAEGDVVQFAETNVVGTLRLIEAARRAGAARFIFISTCAVHEVILPDRPLDEAHPMWPTHHYGAHKAAIEEFVYSYGLGQGYDMCALRPTGIYGLARPAERSKWHGLVQAVKRGEDVNSNRGGKEVHAADVAKAVDILLTAKGIAGQAYNCCDMYISDEEVARIAKRLTGSRSRISDTNKGPKNQISTDKLRGLGVVFGGQALLEKTVRQLVEAG